MTEDFERLCARSTCQNAVLRRRSHAIYCSYRCQRLAHAERKRERRREEAELGRQLAQQPKCWTLEELREAHEVWIGSPDGDDDDAGGFLDSLEASK